MTCRSSNPRTIQSSCRESSPKTGSIVSKLAFSDDYSTLVGAASADVTLPPNVLDLQSLAALKLQGTAFLTSPAGAETYNLNGGLQQGAFSLSVAFAGVAPDAPGNHRPAGHPGRFWHDHGPAGCPRIDAAVALNNGKLGSDSLTLSGQVAFTQDMLSVRSLSFGYLKHRVSDGTGSLDLKSGAYSLSARYQGEYFGDQVSLAAGVQGGVTPGTVPRVLSDLFGRVQPGKVSLTNITVGGTPLPSWALAYRSESGRVRFDGGPGNSLHGWLDPQMAFTVAFADPLPLSGTLEGKVSGDKINASLGVDTVDLQILNELLKTGVVNTSAGPLPIFKVTSGVATGSAHNRRSGQRPGLHGPARRGRRRASQRLLPR